MPRSRNAANGSPDSAPRQHFASRLEDWYHNLREKWARRRGHPTTVIPYAGYGSTEWVRVLARVVLAPPGTEERPRKIRGWRSFTTVPLNDMRVIVTIDGAQREVMSDRGGVVDVVIEAKLTPGWNSVTMRSEDSAEVEALIFVVHPDADYGLISDIDDTVMVTLLPRPFLAAWNTFVLDEHARRPVPGMAALYNSMLQKHPGSPCFYLSTGAWNVAPTLSRFLRRHLFPSGPLLLTDWGPTHDSWFRSGRDHKELTLRRLASEFPGIRWQLVGDDGQHDEEIYGSFAEDHPENVSAVAIRQLSTGEAVLAGGRTSSEEHSTPAVPWVYAPDGEAIKEQLDAEGR